MLTVAHMEAADFLGMDPQAEQSGWFWNAATPELAKMLAEAHGEFSRAVRADDGEILFCGGVVPLHPGLAHGWSVISRRAGPRMTGLVRAGRRYLDALPFRRVEISVRAGFDQGHRFARLLGFTPEGAMRRYGQDGEDHHLYARIRE